MDEGSNEGSLTRGAYQGANQSTMQQQRSGVPDTTFLTQPNLIGQRTTKSNRQGGGASGTNKSITAAGHKSSMAADEDVVEMLRDRGSALSGSIDGGAGTASEE